MFKVLTGLLTIAGSLVVATPTAHASGGPIRHHAALLRQGPAASARGAAADTNTGAAAAGNPATIPMAYGGGSVLTNPRVYLSYWGQEWQAGFTTGGYTSAQAQNYISSFFTNVGGSQALDPVTEYCIGAAVGSTSCPSAATMAGNPSGLYRGSWLDTTPVPATPTDPDVQAAATRAFQHWGDLNAVYFVISPSQHSETGFGTQWCAWHSDNFVAGKQFAYTYLPYMPDAGSACGANYVNAVSNSFGNGYFDGLSIVGGHEYAEAVTDPFPNSGWIDANGNENADKCAWGAGSANGGPGSKNITAGGQNFAVQPLWSNRAGTCALAAVPPPPPVAPLFTLDGFGGVHSAGSTNPIAGSAYWPGWDVARGMAVFPDGSGGYTLDAFGGLHPFGSAPTLAPYTGYWPGWDISRGVVIAPWATPADPAGWTLDGYGGLHPFGSAPWINQAGAYWPGRDIARGAVITSDSVPGNVKGYLLEGFGGLHPVGSAPNLPPYSGYWPGWDIARGVVLTTGSTSSTSPGGCVLDGWGGLHSFGSASTCASTGYWQGQDIARGVSAWSGGAGGWVLRGDGLLYAFGGAPAVSSNVYYGRVIARGAAGG